MEFFDKDKIIKKFHTKGKTQFENIIWETVVKVYEDKNSIFDLVLVSRLGFITKLETILCATIIIVIKKNY